MSVTAGTGVPGLASKAAHIVEANWFEGRRSLLIAAARLKGPSIWPSL